LVLRFIAIFNFFVKGLVQLNQQAQYGYLFVSAAGRLRFDCHKTIPDNYLDYKTALFSAQGINPAL